MMRPETTDRRVRRTRALLRSALLSLVEEKGYDRVTVRDILDRADVGRSTFYAHYPDKDALLLNGFEDIRSAVSLEKEAAGYASGRKAGFLEPLLVVFKHVEEHRHLWQPLVRKGGADLMIRILRDNVTDLVRAHFRSQFPLTKGDERQVEAAIQFVAGATMSLLLWWLENDRGSYSAEDVHAIFRGLATLGVRRFLATT